MLAGFCLPLLFLTGCVVPVQLQDNWWVEKDASALTYLQPADTDAARLWRAFGRKLHGQAFKGPMG